MANGNKSDQLVAALEGALRRDGITARPFIGQDFDLLPEFNWDVRSYDHHAALHLENQMTEILHVVVVVKKKGFLSRDPGETHYRAKCLVACPESILKGRARDDEPFSVSFKANGEILWRSDMGEELEKTVSDYLNKNSELKDAILQARHSNVNAWLEGFTARDYMAINTSKVYSHPRDTVDFVPVSNAIIKAINSFSL